MSRLIALDFDGVISDSAPESFVVALHAYAELRPTTPFRDRLGLFPNGVAPRLSAVVGDALYQRFVELMPLGNRAEDFAIGLHALESGAVVASQTDYDAYRRELDESWLQRFHARFYEVRHALLERDPTGWRALMSAYPDVVSLLLRRAGDALLAIATAKDRRSVELLLRDYGIAELFPEGYVLDKETGIHKDAHLRSLHRSLDVPFHEMLFVDDKVNHLDTAAALGVRCALAAWGYNGEREIALARERGYAVCTLETAEAALFGDPRSGYPEARRRRD